MPLPAPPNELALSKDPDDPNERVTEEESSARDDLDGDSSGLTYDSDAGYLPRSVARDYLRGSRDSDEEEMGP